MTEVTVDGVKINLSNIRIEREPMLHPETGVYLATRWTISGDTFDEPMPNPIVAVSEKWRMPVEA